MKSQSSGSRSEIPRKPAYNQFPTGSTVGFGPSEGYDTVIQLNNRDLFTAEAQEDPVIRQFLEAPFVVYFAAFKSSTQEAELFVHRPRDVLRGTLPPGVEIGVRCAMPKVDRVQTLVMNHERTLAHHSIRTFGIVEFQSDAAQIVHKEEHDPQQDPGDHDAEPYDEEPQGLE